MAMNIGSIGMNPMRSANWYNMAAVNNVKLVQAISRRAEKLESSKTAPRTDNTMTTISASLKKNSTEFIKRYEDSMNRLQQAAKDLSESKANGVANQMAATSSSQDVMNVQAAGKLTSPASYQVDVQQVAAAQTNQSNGAWSRGAPLEGGSFTLATQEGTAEIKVDPTAVKTNRELYSAIADEINRLDLGVTAQMEESGGKVSLTVKSAETGKENGFAISGDFAGKIGLDKAKQAAQDAVYTVRDVNDKLDKGQEYTSASNKVSIGNSSIEATLKKEGTSTIKVGDDVEGMANKLNDLVNTFNDTVKFLDKNADKGTGVLYQMRRMAQLPTGEKALNLAGISANSDGTYTFDREAFTDAMDRSPSLTKNIVSGSYGFAEGLRRGALAGLNTPSAKLVDNITSQVNNMRQTQNIINQLSQSNMMNQWSYSPMGAYSKAGSYNLFNYFTTGAMMNMYI